MRTFAGLLGGLFLVLGLIGLAGAVVLTLGYSFEEPSYTCIGTTGSTTVNCETYEESQTGLQTYALGAGILGGSFLIGGCALIGGAVAGSGRKQAASNYQQQPATSAGPPSYTGGWQGSQGGDAPRS